MPESKFVADAMAGVAEHRRLMRALYEQELLEASIEMASRRIAGGFSAEALTEYEERIERLKRATWGDA